MLKNRLEGINEKYIRISKVITIFTFLMPQSFNVISLLGMHICKKYIHLAKNNKDEIIHVHDGCVSNVAHIADHFWCVHTYHTKQLSLSPVTKNNSYVCGSKNR